MILRQVGLLPVLALCAFAQAAAPNAGQELTLREALELAQRYNPQLRAAQAAIAGATASITTARAYPNPEFSTGFGRQQRTQLSNVLGQQGVFSFSQPLELSSLRRARASVAEIGLQSSEFAASEALLEVRATVKQAFFEAIRRQSEVELSQDTLRLIEDLRRRIQVQVDVGEAARLELTRADAELATARVAVRSSELRRATALAGLRAAIGAPLDGLNPQAALDPPPLLPSLEELRQDVLARHPALGQAQAEVRRGEARMDLERELVKPQPALRTDVERQPDVWVARMGVTVTLPAWDRRKGQIAEAAAAIRQANALADYRRLELTAALERAYGQYEVASEQLVAFESGALREAQAALDAAEAAFRFGERGILEVLDAQRVLRTVRSDYLNAQFDREAALIELERLRAIDLGN